MKVRVDKAQLESVKSVLSEIKNGSTRAISGAINTSLVPVRTKAVQLIGHDVNLKASRIKQDFVLKKSSFSNLSGGVYATGKPVGLEQFGASQTQKGVTARVKRSGSRSLLKHAYLGYGKKGSGYGVWWRAGRSRMPAPKKFPQGKVARANWSAMDKPYRFPVGPKGDRGIQRLTGPRIEDILAAIRIYNPVQALAAEKFVENLDKKVTEVLRRFG